jgi:hypothetical protein
MRQKLTWARAAALLALAPVFGLVWTEVATDAAAQSAPFRRASTGYFVGKVAEYANGRLTILTDDGMVLKATVSPRTKIALLKPADLDDLEEGTFIASAGREKDGDNIEALEIRIMEPRLNGVGEGYRPFHGGLDDKQVMTNAKVVGVVPDVTPPALQVRIRGREKTMVVPDEAPIMFQVTGDATALVAGAPVMVFTVRSRTGKTDVVRVNIGLDGVVPQLF